MKFKERALYFLSYVLAGVVVFSFLYWYFWLAPNENGEEIIRGPAIIPVEEGCYIKMENGECAEPGSF
ncbi:MAG: hypothetical protein OXM55_04450 [Bdellovibrionales bacterium]|nr:hypothetical protein [Bdellovibrionales bacterium]